MVNNYSTCILSQIPPWKGCQRELVSPQGCRREESKRERKQIERDGGDMREGEGLCGRLVGKEGENNGREVGGNRLEDKQCGVIGLG